MRQISLLSDSHSHIDTAILKKLEGSDEIWHAGDIGDLCIMEKLERIAPCRAVYGNIDGQEFRKSLPLYALFELEGLKVLITHIAGYPGRYNKRALGLIKENKPDLFICGHSHILKVMRDHKNGHLHLNPGAVGLQGFHQVRTILQFKIDSGDIKDLQVAEWPRWPR